MSTGVKKNRLGLIGKKLGMSQVFGEDGKVVPVTLVRVGPCFVTQIKKASSDGYDAVQVGFEAQATSRLSGAIAGHFSKAGKGGFKHLREIRCTSEEAGVNELGQEVDVAKIFKDGQLVNVSGVSIGRGFGGVVKKYKVGGHPATRGTHETRRHIGAVGCRKFPGHIFKNKRMPGHMGAANVTVKNLKVMSVDTNEKVLVIKGGIPGARGGLVLVQVAA